MASTRFSFVFLHGLIGDPSNWDMVIDPLRSNGYACLAPEIPYFDDETTRIEEFAGEVMRQIGNVDPDNTVVVGNSIGCSIALYLANYFKKAILVAPFTKMYAYPLPRTQENIVKLMVSLVNDPDRLRDNEVSRHVARYRALLDSKGRIHHVRKLKLIKRAADSFDHAALYDRWQAKTHVIYAGNDRVSPPSAFEEIGRRHPGLALHRIDDCGHAIPVERPDCLVDVLQRTCLEPLLDERVLAAPNPRS